MASYTTKTLAQGEEIVSINKTTKWAYLFAVINSLWVSAVVGIVTIPFGMAVIPFALLGILLVATVGQVWWARLTEEFAVTNKKIVSKRGFIARNTDELLLSKIEGIDVEQGMLARILGCGSLKVTGPGQQVVVFPGIDNPIDVKNQIQAQIA